MKSKNLIVVYERKQIYEINKLANRFSLEDFCILSFVGPLDTLKSKNKIYNADEIYKLSEKDIIPKLYDMYLAWGNKKIDGQTLFESFRVDDVDLLNFIKFSFNNFYFTYPNRLIKNYLKARYCIDKLQPDNIYTFEGNSMLFRCLLDVARNKKLKLEYLRFSIRQKLKNYYEFTLKQNAIYHFKKRLRDK